MSTELADPPEVDETLDTANDELNGDGAAEATADDNTAAEPAAAPIAPEPPLPLSVREAQHYAEIREVTEDVELARQAWQASKDETRDLKKEFDELQGDLRRLIRRGPESQRRLPIMDPSAEATETAASDEPLPVNNEWRKTLIDVLDCGKAAKSKLEHNHVNTLGDLQDIFDARKDLKDLEGIGEAMATKIIDAYSDYGLAHPEIYGEQAAEESPADQGEDETEAA